MQRHRHEEPLPPAKPRVFKSRLHQFRQRQLAIDQEAQRVLAVHRDDAVDVPGRAAARSSDGEAVDDHEAQVECRLLGIDVVHQIVQDLGGRLEVASELGVGTRIDVFLRALSRV